MPRILYKCDICGQEHPKSEVAEACEASHQKALSVDPNDQRISFRDDKGRYPIDITVQMSDGSKWRFHRTDRCR